MSAASKFRPRVALVGVSGYGATHYNYAVSSALKNEIEFLGAAIINQEQEKEKCAVIREIGGLVYSSFDEMLHDLRGHLDLCLIPTGIALHEPMTVAALEAGANVLVEKPLTGSVASAERMLAAERRAVGAVAVGFQDVFHPSVRRLQEMLAGGELGALREIRFHGSWPRGRSYYTRNSWAGKLQVDDIPVRDSPLNNAFAHLLNLSLFFAGPSPGVWGEAEELQADLWRINEIETFDTVALRARLTGGTQLLGWLTHACETTVEPILYLETEDASVVWEYHGDGISIKRPGKDPIFLGTRHNPTTREAMFDRVFSWPVGQPAPCCPMAMAAAHVRCIERIHAESSIYPISAAGCHQLRTDTDQRWVISDYPQILERAMRRKCLFSELRHPTFAREFATA